jgi:hypothetical protein
MKTIRILVVAVAAAAALLVLCGGLGRPASTAQAQPNWQVVTIPTLPPGAVLGQVWSSAPDDVYVWASISTDVPEAYLFHWDGTSWNEVLSLPGHSGFDVFGTGPWDVFASAYKCAAGSAAGCGPDRGPRIFRSTDGGNTWTSQVLPVEMGPDNYVYHMSGTPGNVHGHVSRSVIIRFDGSDWQQIYDAAHGPYALTVLSANEGYYVSCWGWGSWDGASWSFNGVQFDFCDVNSLWGVRDSGGALHLYAAGSNNFENGVRVWRFDEATQSFGSKYGYVFSDGSGAWAGQAIGNGIWGSGPDDIYVLGRIGPWGANDSGRLYHFDGTSWSRITAIGDIPVPNGIWGTAPDDVWVTLPDGRLLHFSSPTPPPGVGGIVEIQVDSADLAVDSAADSSGSSSLDYYGALAGAAAAGAIALAAGALYARRRSLR